MSRDGQPNTGDQVMWAQVALGQEAERAGSRVRYTMAQPRCWPTRSCGCSLSSS